MNPMFLYVDVKSVRKIKHIFTIEILVYGIRNA